MTNRFLGMFWGKGEAEAAFAAFVARNWRDYEHADNFRFAVVDDSESLADYHARPGCCGVLVVEALVAGSRCLMACNYGH